MNEPERPACGGRRRGIARLVAAASVAVAAVLGTAPPVAVAVENVESGWWSTAPAATAVDVPADGLLVQGGLTADSPQAYAALTFTLTEGEAPKSLTVVVADGSATTPNASLVACPVGEAFAPARNGAMADAPSFDCTTKAAASPSADGSSYRFDVAELATGGALSVAIVPAAATDRVVLERPTPNWLATTTPSPGETPEATTDLAPADDAFADEPALEPPAALSLEPFELARPLGPEDAAPAVAAPTPDDVAVAAPSRASTPSAAVAPASASSSSGSSSRLPAVVFTALALVGTTLWLAAGREPDVLAAHQ